jgi:outer membrane protein assembly factor BamB
MLLPRAAALLPLPAVLPPIAAVLGLAAAGVPEPARAKPKESGELLYFAEGNRLHRIDVDTIGAKGGPREEIPIERAAEEAGGATNFVNPNRDVNGMICALPDGSGRILLGEDSGQPSPPPGWGVFERSGLQVGKLTATYFEAQGEPYGCAFAADGTLFTTEVGEVDPKGGGGSGQLILWFGPFDGFPGPPGAYPETDEPSTSFCKIAVDVPVAGAVAIDAQGRVYVAAGGGLQIQRFSPPFPTSPTAGGGCGGTDALGSPLADAVTREVFAGPQGGITAYTGLAIGPNGHLFASSVVTGEVFEFDLDGNLVRRIVDPPEDAPPISTGTPHGIDFGADGTLYYADLDLVGTFPDLGPGPNGKVWRVRFDERGEPLAPEIVREGLAFPDAVAVLPGDLERKKAGGKGKAEWRAYAGGPERRFANRKEKKLERETVSDLVERWRFRTGAVVTASPVVARVEVPGEGKIQVAYFASWDWNVYAVRVSDGSKLWHSTADVQPGAQFPAASSALVERVGDRELVFVGLGEVMYALDAVTGAEAWRFAAGTGCRDMTGTPPGLCDFDGERNEIETSPIVADGKVFFGMDVNDRATGKGGFFAVDAADGRMAWFFDLETGSTCTPDPGDEIRAFDGYHDEAELGLPAGFLATRAGCGFDRTPTGCGNVWSSPAVDEKRGLLFFGSSNCDTDDDDGTPEPPPPMPPYDEALVALRFDGSPAWRWRPREVDNDDFAFGATPNLFTIELGRRKVDVVGIGNKDGTYSVIDRDGVNELTGLGFDPADPHALPYWERNLVPGGPLGGIIGTPAVDPKARRIYVGTAPGFDPTDPQRPTVHALDADTGAVLWDNGTAPGAGTDASFGPTSVTKDLVFVGGVVAPRLRLFDANTGALLCGSLIGDQILFSAVASGPAVVDGTLLVGTGIGTRTGDPSDPAEIAASVPSSVVALCVPKSKGCPEPEPSDPLICP